MPASSTAPVKKRSKVVVAPPSEELAEESSLTLITLKGVCAEKIYFEYLHVSEISDAPVDLGGGEGIHQTIVDFTPSQEEEVNMNALTHDKSKRAMWFLDSHKTKAKYWVSMIDVTQSEASTEGRCDGGISRGGEGGIIGSLPSHTSNPCWWCRHTFATKVLGCPVKYNPCKLNSASHPLLHSVERARVEQKFRKSKLPTTSLDFFETEGVFCSFPCIKAYILSQNLNSRYKESNTLLSLLYLKLTGNSISHIPPAPSWKILIEYGGHLTIKEYRATFGKLEYTESVSVRRPYMFCSSKYIEERRIKN